MKTYKELVLENESLNETKSDLFVFFDYNKKEGNIIRVSGKKFTTWYYDLQQIFRELIQEFKVRDYDKSGNFEGMNVKTDLKTFTDFLISNFKCEEVTK